MVVVLVEDTAVDQLQVLKKAVAVVDRTIPAQTKTTRLVPTKATVKSLSLFLDLQMMLQLSLKVQVHLTKFPRKIILHLGRPVI